MSRSDLLDLCANFPQMKFIIFTNLEDTPIDDFILNKIPENVACISAVNAITHNDKSYSCTLWCAEKNES